MTRTNDDERKARNDARFDRPAAGVEPHAGCCCNGGDSPAETESAADELLDWFGVSTYDRGHDVVPDDLACLSLTSADDPDAISFDDEQDRLM